jgi:superfamily II DNA or RNA helicase
VSEKLKQHLASKGVDVLQPLLGEQVVELLKQVGSEAMAPDVMADLIITSRGAAEVLRDKQIRKILIEGLQMEDYKDLCILLNLGVSAPRFSIRNHNFDLPNSAQVIFEWFNVAYEGYERVDDFSRNISSSEKLKPFQEPAYRKLKALLNDPVGRVLVHMPFGAGKLRTVVTSVLEAFRSESEGKSILWLAPDECLCDVAMHELETVWHQLGLRDVTAYRLYGNRHPVPIGSVSNAIVVADVNDLAIAVSDPRGGEAALQTLRDFGTCVRHVVLSDAEHALLPEVRKILEALGEKGSWNLIGISASPKIAIAACADPEQLVTAYGRNIVEVNAENPINALRENGEVDPINVIRVPSPVASIDCQENWISLPSSTVEELALDVSRNRDLLDKLHELAHQGHRVVFYSTTSQQARMFAGLLSLKGSAALAVTSEMEPSRRELEILRFNSDTRNQVLCTHGVLISSDQVVGINACMIGLPATSGAIIHEIVGRLATGRKTPLSPLQIYAVTDPVPRYLRLIERLEQWDRLTA